MAIANNPADTERDKVQIIRALWSAGYACPESDVELDTLWQRVELDLG